MNDIDRTMSSWTLVSGTFLQKVAIGPTNQFMVAIQYNPSGNTVVYSRDFGVTWTPSTGITGNANCISSCQGSTVLVGVNSVASHIYYSNNFGTSFTALTNSPSSYWTIVGISQSTTSRMVACDFTNDTATIYYSADGGYSWSQLNSYSGTIITKCAWSNNYDLNSIYVVGFMTSTPFSSSMYRTNDTGVSWYTVPNSFEYNIQDVACDETGQYVVISVAQGGVYRSIDFGVSWYKTTAPSFAPSGPNMGSIVCDMTGNHILVMDVNVPSVYASEDSGITWTLQTTAGSNLSGDIFPLSMSPDGSYRFVSYWPGLYSNIVPAYQSVNFTNNTYNPLLYVACNNYSGEHMSAIGSTQYGQGKCIVYSNDYGLTWNLSNADSSGDSIYTCMAASANGRYVVAGFQNGPHGVVFSNNYGISFNIVTNGLDFIPSAVAVSNDGELFYATTADGSGAIYVGYLSGSVVSKNDGIPGMYWKSIACSGTNGQYVYATAQHDNGPYYLYKTQFGIPNIYVPMNGTLTDVTGNSNVTPYGSITYVQGITSQYAMSLVNTVGANAYNYIRGTIASDFSALTVSFWMNLQTDSGSDYPTIFATCNNSIIVYLLPGSNILNVGFPSGTTVNNVDTSFVITRDTWYHIRLIFQVGTCSVFVNNTLVGTTTSTGRGSFSGTEYSFGCYNNSTGQSFTGYIDDLKIYYNAAGTFEMWEEVPRFASSPLLPLMVTCDESGDVITVAAGSDGVYQSTDAGITWVEKNSLTSPTVQPELMMPFTAIQSGLNSYHWVTNSVGWDVSASTYQGTQYPYIPFRETLDDSWNTSSVSYTPSGNTSGIMNTFYTNGTSTTTVEGDWLQLKSSIPIVLSSYEIGCGNSNNLPTMFYIVGSNDRTNWYAIQYGQAAAKPFDAIYQVVPGTIIADYNGSQAWGNTILTTTSYDGSSKAYTHFRMIVLSSFYAPGTCAQIGKWITYFLPTASPVVDLPLNDTVLDQINVSTITTYGFISYTAGGATLNAVNLENTVGSTPSNYIRGTCAPVNTDFTFSIKFTPKSFDAGSQPIIFGMGSTSNTVFQLVMDYATTLTLQIYDSNYSWHVLTLGTLSADTWYSVYVNYQKSGTISAYLNDILADSTAGVSFYVAADQISLGTYTHETSGAFNGYIRDVRIEVEGHPFIHLPFGAEIKDVLNNSTISVYGNIPYISNISDTYAANLLNTVGENSYQADNYIRGTISNGMTQFTVTGWFNPYSDAGNAYPTIFSMYGQGIMLFYTPGSNAIVLHVPSGIGTDQNVINGPSLNLNTWYSFMIVFQYGNCQLYLNNELIGTTPTVGLGSFGSTTFSLGCYDSSTGQPFRGAFSNIHIYNTALSPLPGRSITKIASDSTGTNLVVADAIHKDVFRSTDSGTTWAAQIIDGVYTTNILNVSIDPTGTYTFASYETYSTFMSQRSSGLTTSWTVTSGQYYPIMTFSNNNIKQAAINSIGSYNETGYPVIAYSSDSGSTWTNGPNLDGFTNGLAADSTGQYVVAVLEIFSSSQPAVYRSTDYGVTFSALSGSPDYVTYGANCITCDSTGQKMYVGTYSGDVFISQNGGTTWTSISQSSSVFGITCSYTGQYVFTVINGNYIAVSSDYGMTWSSNITISSHGNGQIACDWTGQYVVAACYNDGIYRSTDYGQTWTKTSAPSNPSASYSNYYYDIACNSTGNRIIAMDGNNSAVYISTDAGTSWTLQYTPGGYVGEAFTGVSISPDGTRYSAGFWATGSHFLTSGSPDIPSVPCFLEGTQILCMENDVEVYKAIETIRPGTLVKTSRDGYKPVKLIGSRVMTNPGTATRDKNSLYLCTKAAYPELTADLTITGCHAILVAKITDVQRADIIKTLERIFVTDKKYRLPACCDDRASVVQTTGTFTVWHFALDHYDIKMNYGVYAQGLLVETSPIWHMNTKNYNLVQ